MPKLHRIVCLSAESADWLWRIGAWEQVAGVTSFFTHPPGAAPKPRVSGFSTGRLDEIAKLDPDLIITFSDVQAQLAADLVKRGFAVLATNQRTLAEIESTLELLGRIAGHEKQAQQALHELRARLAPVKSSAPRPRVYFEEWNDPLVSGICWVSELIERAGGSDAFADLRTKRAALERVISPEQVAAADPDIIIASWCGKPVEPKQIAGREGWKNLRAVRSNRIHEIASEDILQPGFRLAFGYDLLKQLLSDHAYTKE